jgi:site-specific recombinase XerD
MVRTAGGEVAEFVDVPPLITKRTLGAGRVPLAPDAKTALVKLYERRRRPSRGAVLIGGDHEALSAHALVQRLKRLYSRAGLNASSHSGRRTYGDALAKTLNLRSLQTAMRHRDMASTLRYFDAESDATIAAAIRALG